MWWNLRVGSRLFRTSWHGIPAWAASPRTHGFEISYASLLELSQRNNAAKSSCPNLLREIVAGIEFDYCFAAATAFRAVRRLQNWVRLWLCMTSGARLLQSPSFSLAVPFL